MASANDPDTLEIMSKPGVLLVVALALPFLQGGSCPNSNVAYGTIDANFVLDGGCVIKGLNCNQMGDCSTACGSDEGCVDNCQNSGCPTAQQAFADIRSCTIRECISRCAGGATQACLDCSNDRCASEHTACDEDMCPIDCSGVMTPDASVVPTGDGGTGASCSEIYACMDMCILETPILCRGRCLLRGCDSSRDAMEALMDCADRLCTFDAGETRCEDRYASPECQSCLVEKCSADWNACSATGC